MFCIRLKIQKSEVTSQLYTGVTQSEMPGTSNYNDGSEPWNELKVRQVTVKPCNPEITLKFHTSKVNFRILRLKNDESQKY